MQIVIKQRLEELDILRGLSVIGMIMVIVPGAWEYRFEWLNHAEWEGYPLVDMISPTFLFCVGFSLAISFKKRIEKENSRTKIIKHIFIRSILIILIGFFVSLHPGYDFANMRIPGILQRIGLCYLIVGLLVVYSEKIRRNKTYKSQITFFIVVACSILILYWVLLSFVPVPGFGAPRFDSIGSWPTYIDRKVFGTQHLWYFGRTNDVVTYDPDGLLTVLTSSINVMLGSIIGFLYLNKSKFFNVSFLFIIGSILCTLGLLLNFTGIDFIIKKIGTSSFTLVSGGFSIIVFALISTIKKIKYSLRFFYPAKVFGANALLAFVIALKFPIDNPYISMDGELLSLRKFGFESFKMLITNPQYASFFFTVIYLTLLFLILWLLYKRKWFIKL